MTDGRYIALEGGDGSGKSTQIALLVDALGALETREPGATGLGRELRRLFLGVDGTPVGERAETLLLAADRAQHMLEVVEPALAAGRHVVSDRSAFSSLAYQGVGRGLGIEEVRAINEWALGGRWPDVVVLLDADPSASHRRLERDLDRFEREALDFHRTVRAAYLDLAAADPDRWVVVDGTQAIEVVHAEIRVALSARGFDFDGVSP